MRKISDAISLTASDTTALLKQAGVCPHPHCTTQLKLVSSTPNREVRM